MIVPDANNVTQASTKMKRAKYFVSTASLARTNHQLQCQYALNVQKIPTRVALLQPLVNHVLHLVLPKVRLEKLHARCVQLVEQVLRANHVLKDGTEGTNTKCVWPASQDTTLPKQDNLSVEIVSKARIKREKVRTSVVPA